MNAVIIEVVRGKDGKRYPSGLPRPGAEVERLRLLAHQFYCGRGLSYRDVQAVMLDQNGVRRSIGILHRDVAEFDCGGAYGRPCRGGGADG